MNALPDSDTKDKTFSSAAKLVTKNSMAQAASKCLHSKESRRQPIKKNLDCLFHEAATEGAVEEPKKQGESYKKEPELDIKASFTLNNHFQLVKPSEESQRSPKHSFQNPVVGNALRDLEELKGQGKLKDRR